MAKVNRKMSEAGQAQKEIEKITEDKFSSTQELAQPRKEIKLDASNGRISPQLSCTITQEDMIFLQQLTLELSIKNGRVIKLSQAVRSLIALGKENKEKLTVIE